MGTKMTVRVATTTRKKFRAERIEEPGAHGTRWLPDGEEEIRYEASIDVDALEAMARKAATNTRGVSTDGPLTVKIVARKKL